MVRYQARNVKRWRNGEQVLRWSAAGLQEAEARFRRVKGYKQIPCFKLLCPTLKSPERPWSLSREKKSKDASQKFHGAWDILKSFNFKDRDGKSKWSVPMRSGPLVSKTGIDAKRSPAPASRGGRTVVAQGQTVKSTQSEDEPLLQRVEMVETPVIYSYDDVTRTLVDVVQAVILHRRDAASDSLTRIPFTPPNSRIPGAVSDTLKLAVWRRDSFTCRYCGKATLFVPVLHVLSRLFPTHFPDHPNWKMDVCHPVYWTHSASCDHLIPAARGGPSKLDNLMTACYKCNSIKQNWLIEELRWTLLPPANSTWDGLSGCYSALCEAAGVLKDGRFSRWLKLLKSSVPSKYKNDRDGSAE